MSALREFPVGVGPTIVLGIPIRSTPGSLDLTTVTGVTLYPLRPDGSSPSSPWVAALAPAPGELAVTPVSALVQYPFQTTDLTMKGVWRLQVQLTTPSGPWPNAPELTPEFRVTDPWGQP